MGESSFSRFKFTATNSVSAGMFPASSLIAVAAACIAITSPKISVGTGVASRPTNASYDPTLLVASYGNAISDSFSLKYLWASS